MIKVLFDGKVMLSTSDDVKVEMVREPDPREKEFTGFVVWEPGIKPDGRVMLRLKQYGGDGVAVHIVDKNGISGWGSYILNLGLIGLLRHCSINNGLGIPCDKEGRIKE